MPDELPAPTPEALEAPTGTPTPEATAPATPETTPAPETQAAPVEITAETAPDALAGLSKEDRRALLFGDNKTATTAPITPPIETPATPAPEIPATPVAATLEAEEEITKNFRLHTDDPKLSGFLKALKTAQNTNPNVNPVDVARLVGYDMPGQPAAPETPAEVPGLENTPAPGPIDTIKTEIEDLEKQLAEKEDELISPEYNALQAQLRAKERELTKAELKAEAAHDSGLAKQKTAREASKEATLVDYPTANDGDSLLGAEIERQFLSIQSNPSHPDRAQVGRDDFPAFLTKKAADAVTARLEKSGMTKAQALAAVKGKPTAEASRPATTVSPNATPPVPRTVLVTAPGGNPAPTPLPIDPAQLLERARSDPAFRRAALFGETTGVTIS